MKNNWIDFDERPWGKYYVLYEDNLCKVKKIIVNPAGRLSYQYHNQRSEIWQIIKGSGKTIINGKSKEVEIGDTIKIKVGEKHRIENNGKDELIFIEIQTGTYFGEDDIVRITDDYNRIK
tara:strand:- start:34953 stop:35312 length:360 start_codon:yes stop_codon:yes gene_type:complete